MATPTSSRRGRRLRGAAHPHHLSLPLFIAIAALALNLQGATIAGHAAPPTSRTGRWQAASALPTLPDSKLPDSPLLGNGYTGVLLGLSSPPPSAAPLTQLDLHINTNAMWACGAAPGGSLVPATCSRVAFGGITLGVPASAAPQPDKFAAAQHISNGTLTAAIVLASGTLAVSAALHPAANTLVANVSWSGAQPLNTTVTVWALAAPHTAAAAVSAADPTSAVVSRRLDGGSGSPPADIRTLWAALAVRVAAPAAAGTRVGAASVQHNTTRPNTAAAQIPVTVGAHGSFAIVGALSDSLLTNNSVDPSPAALDLVQHTQPGQAVQAAKATWDAFYNASSISLPSLPTLEAFWFGAQYITASMTPSPAVLQRTRNLAPPSGLYGPWVTSDSPAWHGDYTLDYNQEAQFYGVFSSNHAELAASYFPPIVDWMGAARAGAQAAAKTAGISCPAGALHYSCHLAPWGYQSQDQTIYMHWNGMFAALPMISHWEYTRNASVARAALLPLLEGLNAWSACFLRNVSSGGSGGHVLEDFRLGYPDEEHENQKVVNPQIGLALIRRMATAHLELAAALNVSVPPAVADIAAHLAPFNSVTAHVPPPPPPLPMPAGAFNISTDVRCTGDYHMGGEANASACALGCYLDGACNAFSFCPKGAPEPAGFCPGAATCWRYHDSKHCAAAPHSGFVSGVRAQPLPPSNTTVPVWTAFKDAPVVASDAFSVYPVWPSEALHPALTAGVGPTARASTRTYASPLASGRPVLVFSAAVRAGAGPGWGWAPQDIVQGLLDWLNASQGQNFVPYAPGGGTENAGVAAALNDMLVQAPGGGPIILFPVWPGEHPATFRQLRTKGGFLVSASQAAGAVGEDVEITATAPPPSRTCQLHNPWPAAPPPASVVCNNQPRTVKVLPGGVLAWAMDDGDVCRLTGGKSR